MAAGEQLARDRHKLHVLICPLTKQMRILSPNFMTEHFLAPYCTVQNKNPAFNKMGALSTSHPGAQESTELRYKVAPKAAPDSRR
jgi:hypothetical protein